MIRKGDTKDANELEGDAKTPERKWIEVISQNGSHVKMKNLKTDKTVIVPYHSKDLKKGLEQAILKQAGLR